MCVSTAPAEFTGTIVHLGKKYHKHHGEIFVLGYQNTAQNYSSGPNAMLLHFPAMGMTQQNFLDTRPCRHILKDMVKALTPVSRGISFGGLSKGSVQLFEHDIYTVVLASDVSLIPSVLPLVPANKRIAINQPLFNFYAQWFSGYAAALCCFDNRQAADAAPLLVWYRPINPYYFQLPALDCHTGGVPDLEAQVAVDHWVLLSSDDMSPGRSHAVHYTDSVPASVQAFLPQRVIGQRFSGRMRNGDFGIGLSDVREGRTAALERIGPAR